jgi:hypothetical protein
MEAELFGTEWAWFGKDRKGRPGGGIGFLVRKCLKPRMYKPSKLGSVLWLEFEHVEKWFVAVVYLVPKDSIGVKQVTLDELERDILELVGKGRIVVLGDFNARVGELPNIINSFDDLSDTPQRLPRRSEDKTVKSTGRRVLNCLNRAGMNTA